MTMMIDKAMGFLQYAIRWLSSRPNRLRLRGARVEVIAFIMAREPEASILLGQSPLQETWMPPQEGVGLEETFEAALFRCLSVECGVDLPAERNLLERTLYVRSIRYVGLLKLPTHRHGSRLVADDAAGTLLESIVLRRKAYWAATIVLGNQDRVSTKPDGNELVNLKWFSREEARKIITMTNRPDKAALLVRCLDECFANLHGGLPVTKREV
jgi:hypothetical protein